MQQYLVVARITNTQFKSINNQRILELLYIEYDYHNMSYKNFLSLEREYIDIYKEYSADITKLMKDSQKSYIINTNMSLADINKGIHMADDSVPAFVQNIITDHMTPQRIRKWLGRALNALSPSMVQFNRVLLSYLYDIKKSAGEEVIV